MHVRRGTTADHPFMMSLAGRLAGAADFPWRTAAEVDAFQRAFMTEALRRPDTLTLVAEDGPGGPPLGFAALEPHPDDITGDGGGYLSLLAVTATAEGRGVARALMAAAEDVARQQGWRVLALDVFVTNTRGRRFYDSLGFGAETLRLVKPLPPAAG